MIPCPVVLHKNYGRIPRKSFDVPKKSMPLHHIKIQWKLDNAQRQLMQMLSWGFGSWL